MGINSANHLTSRSSRSLRSLGRFALRTRCACLRHCCAAGAPREAPLNWALATVFFNFAKAREVLLQRTTKMSRAGGFLKKSGQCDHFTSRSNASALAARWWSTQKDRGSSAKVPAGTPFGPQIFAALAFTSESVNFGQRFCGAQCKAGFLFARAKFTANKAFKPLVALLLTGTPGFAGRPLTRR